jgi:hypothetical protein
MPNEFAEVSRRRGSWSLLESFKICCQLHVVYSDLGGWWKFDGANAIRVFPGVVVRI